MFFQKVLKGIPGLTDDEAEQAFEWGIQCIWWRRVKAITPAGIVEKLTERNLDWHLNRYDTIDPVTGVEFFKNTPYISATAGTVERDVFARRNLVFDPFFTALRFATRDFTISGHIFYAYVFTLGKQSVPLEAFAEEVRELNIYKHYLPFHPEGEITAKIIIRGPQIERTEEYDGVQAERELRSGRFPRPSSVLRNLRYAPPERYCNIRGLITD